MKSLQQKGFIFYYYLLSNVKVNLIMAGIG